MPPRAKYNLRPREQITRVRKVPKPRCGDCVSVYWENLEQEYEGTLKRYDPHYKTFLVEYDSIPKGFQTNNVWEALDNSPWRLLSRNGKQVVHNEQSLNAKNDSEVNCQSQNNEERGNSDDECNPDVWIQPGDLADAYPEFKPPVAADQDSTDEDTEATVTDEGQPGEPLDENEERRNEHETSETVSRESDYITPAQSSTRTEEPEKRASRKRVSPNIEDTTCREVDATTSPGNQRNIQFENKRILPLENERPVPLLIGRDLPLGNERNITCTNSNHARGRNLGNIPLRNDNNMSPVDTSNTARINECNIPLNPLAEQRPAALLLEGCRPALPFRKRKYSDVGSTGSTVGAPSHEDLPRIPEYTYASSRLPRETIQIAFLKGTPSSIQEAEPSNVTYGSTFISAGFGNASEARRMEEQVTHTLSDEEQIRMITRTLGIRIPRHNDSREDERNTHW